MIRDALPTDAAAILDIYGPFIEDSPITFETEIPTADAMAARITENSRFGWLVHEDKGEITGYAYASPHRARTAYQWCCEVSAYISPTHQRRGIASLLYKKLFADLKIKGFVNAYAGITLPNDKSVQFHESHGFKFIGTYEKIGFKLGTWRDVGWWGLKLLDPPQNPIPPRAISRPPK